MSVIRAISPRALPLRRALAAAVLGTASLAAQSVDDIGLVVDPSAVPPLGQQCGPVSCSPLSVGFAAPGTSRTFVHQSAPLSPFVLAIGLPGPCLPFPGIKNSLLLLPPPQVVALGMTSHEPFVPTPCAQGVAFWRLDVPPGAPVGLRFAVQGIGFSNSGALGFGPALELTVR